MAKLQKTASGKVDKRTAEGKAISERLEKARLAKEKKANGFLGLKKLFSKK